jgi:hypothetical protein
MFRQLAIIVALALFSGSAFGACNSDYDCGYGNRCVKAKDDINLSGVCVTPTDKYGNRTFSNPPPSSQPHKVDQCSYDTQCPIGYSCMKRSGQIYGICVK